MKATFHLCKAMQASLSSKADGQQSSLGHCERASSHLWNSLNMSSGASSTPLSNVRAAYCRRCVICRGLVVSVLSVRPESDRNMGDAFTLCF